jgi:hypothetical protein
MAAAAERIAVADRVPELIEAVEGRGVGAVAAVTIAVTSTVRLGPMAVAGPTTPAPTMAATFAPTLPATVARTAAIVLGQGGLPGGPSMAIVHGQADRRRDQDQDCAAGQEKAGHGRGRSGSRAGWASSHALFSEDRA